MNFRMKCKMLYVVLLTSAMLLSGLGLHAQSFADSGSGGKGSDSFGVGPAVSPNVVISQIFGGGGNSGAPYNRDYIELFNNSNTAVVLDGFSVQYNTSTGTTGIYSVTTLTGSIAARGYYLVGEDFGTGGNGNGINVDASGNTSIAAPNGRVALVSNNVALASNSTANASGILDFVGYGTAVTFEGTGAAPAGSNTSAPTRKSTGSGATLQFTDTDQNASDFISPSPTPVPHFSGGPAETPAPPGLISLLIGICVSGWKARRRKQQAAEDVTAG